MDYIEYGARMKNEYVDDLLTKAARIVWIGTRKPADSLRPEPRWIEDEVPKLWETIFGRDTGAMLPTALLRNEALEIVNLPWILLAAQDRMARRG